MGRLIQEKLKKALAEDILFGQLTEGGDVFVTAADSIEIRVEANVKGKKRALAEEGDSFTGGGAELSGSIGDAAFGQVIGRKFHTYSVAGKDAM